MNFKTFLVTAIATFSLGMVNAQDKLYKKNGDMMEVKVTEVTPKVISYKRAHNPEGPTYTINKADVAKIVYPNGGEDYFGEANQKQTPNQKPKVYGNNIISIMPMQLFAEGPGVGLAYERVLDKNGILSFYLPMGVAFVDNGNVNPMGAKNYPTYYIMPGLKFYPTGGKGVVRYAVGPNLAYVNGKRNDFIYDNMGNVTGFGLQTRSALGIMVTNSLNINPTTHIHLGMELGLGFNYFDRFNGVDMGATGLVQFGFKIGYRF